MTIKVGNTEFTFDGYFNFSQTIRNLADKCYQQGRADKYQEITSEYMLFTEKQVEEIRADAIDLIDRHLWNYSQEVWEDFKPILKQLKEHDNEQE